MTIAMPPTAYCTIANIQDRLSINGVTLRLDDVPPDEWGDVLNEAATIIDEHCFTRYSTNLQQSAWVVYRATDIAAQLLCERRGNPAPAVVAKRAARAIEALMRVQAGSMNIYDIPEQRTAAPTMSNVRVILRPYPRSVVETGVQRSTGTVTTYPRNRDPYDAINAGIDLNWTL